MAQVVKLASRLPCREVRRTLTGLTAGVLSHSTIYGLVGRATQHAQKTEKQAWHVWFEAGAERDALVGKRVHCHGGERLPCWEAASMEWSRP